MTWLRKDFRLALWSSVLVCAALFSTISSAEDSTPEAKPPSIFDLPLVRAQFAAAQQELVTRLNAGQLEVAERLARQAVALVPHDAGGRYNLACALARAGKADEALTELRQSIAFGFNQSDGMRQDEDLAGLRERREFAELVELAKSAKPDPKLAWNYAATPRKIADGVAMVDESNVTLAPGTDLFLAAFVFDEAAPDKPVVSNMGPAGEKVARWFGEKTAAGNWGDLYDNHDTDHSNMDYDAFGHLSRIEFSPEAQQRGLHHGLQARFFYNAPTLGNSSTALTQGFFWRSQGRFALSQPAGAPILALQYGANQLFVYPEHVDHDPGHNGKLPDGSPGGHGDLLPANHPYLLLSQGSSGSDRPLLHAVALILAAFQPETKTKLAKAGQLAPTIQQVFRSSFAAANKPEEYLTGKCHPSVFDGAALDMDRMVELAHAIAPDALPPMSRIKILEEDEGTPGIDWFDAGGEKLFDTPCAIARVHKTVKLKRRMVVSAVESTDPQGGLLEFRWVVLRGDESTIQLTPRADGRECEIVVDWPQRRPIAPGAAMESRRVDIGLFVNNGAAWSAPSFVSISSLDNQRREYDEAGRIAMIDYADPTASLNYVDPILDAAKDWRDEYAYDDAGTSLGWTRVRGEKRERFTFDGALAIEFDDQNRPTKAHPVRYVPEQRPNERPRLLAKVDETKTIPYVYAGPSDRRGQRKD